MEWMNRGARPSTPAPGQSAVSGAPAPSQHQVKSPRGFSPMKLATVILLFSGSILIVAIAGFFAIGGNKEPSQNKYVDTKNLQAVFLNGGQVYFGNINTLNDQFVRMSNIYYLRVNQTVQPNGQTNSNQDISLVKLGCELHGPQDQMVINQSQVIFWENLKSDGQVAKAVADYQKQNPNGQQCNTSSSSSNSSSTSGSTSNSSSNTSTTKKN